MCNRLSKSNSPYLLQHADNPINWQLWDRSAFNAAHTLSRPIFLSIGYSCCHWCHVMASDSFSDHNLASFLNAHFVCIKVDREERPDIDKQYMSYVQATRGGGGWPLSVWMTPQGRPFFGCTFLWKQQLLELCEFLANQWRDSRDKVEGIAEQGHQLVVNMATHAVHHKRPVVQNAVDVQLFEHLLRNYDTQFGGFTRKGPKFPTVVNLSFLLDYFKVCKEEKALDMVLHSAKVMIKSGLHDHLEGGFHRYCVDTKWTTPHFEKMLYDQAQLLELFSELATIAKGRDDDEDELIAGCNSIISYVTSHLKSTNGTFVSAEDADSLNALGVKEEGAFAVWTFDELQQLFPDQVDLDLIVDTFNVKPEGNSDELIGKNILNRLHHNVDSIKAKYDDYDGRLRRCMDLMSKHRNHRPRPHCDEKIITSWNALMISGLVKAAHALNNKIILDDAINAFNAINSTPLKRTHSSPACADDYSFMVKAALDIHQVTLNEKYLQAAIDLHSEMERLFANDQRYYYNQVDPEGILIRTVDDYDGAEPSANSMASLNLLRLYKITGHDDYEQKLKSLLMAFSGLLSSAPFSLSMMARTVCLNNHDMAVISLPELTPDVVDVLKGFSRQSFVIKQSQLMQVCRGNTCHVVSEGPGQLEQMLHKLFEQSMS